MKQQYKYRCLGKVLENLHSQQDSYRVHIASYVIKTLNKKLCHRNFVFMASYSQIRMNKPNKLLYENIVFVNIILSVPFLATNS